MKSIISFVIRNVPRKYLQLFSHFAARVLSLFYLGNKVVCPVCGSHYRKFLPYGRIGRENALCPNCLSLERHRLMWLYLKEKTDFFTASHKLLHVAPEYCFLSRFEVMTNLDYITADIESPLAKIKMDIHQIPFEANTFDVTFCNHVMEHVTDDLKAMQELHRILKPGGWAIIQSPLDTSKKTTLEDPNISSPAERLKHYWQEDHLRLYGLDYKNRLEKAGFEVTADDFVKNIPTETAEKHALPGNETIYFCRKP
ncbi:MAG: class I SAM-dependent methyltransferase [Verrucomicrobia bacterium]|nr:class I SAM-dependent methyltransferase [Cytophagales bacterium]